MTQPLTLAEADVAALDHPRRADVPADLVRAHRDREISRAKLLALAGALSDLGLQYRTLFASGDRVPLLRVWDPAKQHLGETLACLRLDEGWRFTAYPTGPVLADADDVDDPEGAGPAAGLVAEAVRAVQPRRWRRDR